MNDAIKVMLDCEQAEIVERVQKAYWNGRYVPVQFVMRLPDTESELVLMARVHILVNSLPAADTIFKILVSPNSDDLASSVVNQQGRSYRQHFFSYAKEDRREVMKARRALKLANTEAFMDVLSMRAGEDWEHRLEEEIERRDVFVLFWSRHARASGWVIREAEYALKCAKRDPSNPQPKMQPYPLEPPDTAGDPPESLRELHLNDPDLYPILYEERRAHAKHVEAQEDAEAKRILLLGGLTVAMVGFCLSAIVVANYVVARFL